MNHDDYGGGDDVTMVVKAVHMLHTYGNLRSQMYRSVGI